MCPASAAGAACANRVSVNRSGSARTRDRTGAAASSVTGWSGARPIPGCGIEIRTPRRTSGRWRRERSEARVAPRIFEVPGVRSVMLRRQGTKAPGVYRHFHTTTIYTVRCKVSSIQNSQARSSPRSLQDCIGHCWQQKACEQHGSSALWYGEGHSTYSSSRCSTACTLPLIYLIYLPCARRSDSSR